VKINVKIIEDLLIFHKYTKYLRVFNKIEW